jgi:hypothetical protein
MQYRANQTAGKRRNTKAANSGTWQCEGERHYLITMQLWEEKNKVTLGGCSPYAGSSTQNISGQSDSGKGVTPECSHEMSGMSGVMILWYSFLSFDSSLPFRHHTFYSLF